MATSPFSRLHTPSHTQLYLSRHGFAPGLLCPGKPKYFQHLGHGAEPPSLHLQTCGARLLLKHSGCLSSKQQLGLLGTSRGGSALNLAGPAQREGHSAPAMTVNLVCARSIDNPTLAALQAEDPSARTPHTAYRSCRQRSLTRAALHCAAVFCWEQRPGRYFCGRIELQMLWGTN